MLKKFIAFILTAALVMSLIPMVGMAAATVPAQSGAADSYPWVGTNIPEAGFYLDNTENGVTTNTTNYNGATTISNMSYQASGVYGKSENDASYYTFDANGRTATAVSHSKARDYFLTRVSSDYSNAWSDAVVEFAFAYKTAGTGSLLIDSRFRFYNGTSVKNSDNFFQVTTDNIIFGGTTVKYSFEPNRWYTVTLVCDFKDNENDESEINYKAYVNGVPVMNASDSSNAYRCLYEARLFPGVNSEMYWDNISGIEISNAKTFTSTDATPVTLTSTDDDITINGDIITLPGSKTIGEVKTALLGLGSNDTIKFYKNDYSAVLNYSTSAAGSKAVIESTASGEGNTHKTTFTYYDLEKYIYRYGDELYDGTYTKLYTSVPEGVTSVRGGTIGKAADDDYIAIGTLGNLYNVCGSQQDTVHTLEFSMYIPSGIEGASTILNTGYYALNSTEDYVSYDFSFDSNGISFAGGDVFAQMPLDEWVNFAVVAPKAEGDTDMELYMNGKCIYSEEIKDIHDSGFVAGGGFRNIRFAEGTNNIYLDNIRKLTFVSNMEYNPRYDFEPIVSATNNYVNTREKTITVIKGNEAVTVKNIVDDIKATGDKRIVVYDASGNLVNDYTGAISDGYKIVIAVSNDTSIERAYSYYTVRVVDNEIAFDTPYITYNSETGKVNAFWNVYNYTENAPQYKVYLAVYENNSLKSVSPRSIIAASNSITAIDDLNVTLGEGETAKFLVWSTDGITPLFPSQNAE